MNETEVLREVYRIVRKIHELLHELGPGDATTILCGAIIANVVGPIPDDYWSKMFESAKKPCCQPDCDCEKLKTELMSALDSQRTDWKEQTGH